ncbi:MAG: hypothetical protein U5N58_15275 [Actinomycetota bacterium]|nr:hypothetical protein [Actinomycetota bacterium]MDZ7839157.1 hypothetical protein [Actinomycetota bacterium]
MSILCLVEGLVHYITSHINRFIPVTEAEVVPIDGRLNEGMEKRSGIYKYRKNRND